MATLEDLAESLAVEHLQFQHLWHLIDALAHRIGILETVEPLEGLRRAAGASVVRKRRLLLDQAIAFEVGANLLRDRVLTQLVYYVEQI